MDVKELRVGNWTDNNVELLQITKKDLAFLLTADNEHYANPIELTERWLLKFGFEDDSYANFSKKISEYSYLVISFKDYACAQLREVVSIADHDIECHCKYVHQLQNLYYTLTNQELEIK